MDKIHYTQLPASRPDSNPGVEWETYQREVARLLQEGHEGKWLLIKGTEIIGLWGSHAEAYAEALKRYLLEPCLIHQIREWEPVVRGPFQLMLWQHLNSPSARTA